MTQTTRRVGLALALTLFAAPLQAQQAPPTAPQIPDNIRAMAEEFQSLRGRVSTVQDSVLATSPELREEQAAIQELIEARMIEANPGLEQEMARMDELRTAAAEAEATRDRARMQGIMREGTRIRNELQAAQQVVLEQDEVQARVEAFETRVREAMTRIDADIGSAIDRMDDLAARLQAFQAGGR